MFLVKPEILAPAGNSESLVAAVYSGADAVYLGSKALNARRNAGNFDDKELENSVYFCHSRGVKVYQTLNTVIFEKEADEARRAVEYAARLAIDGILVQDFGVANIAQSVAPNLPVYASTQMAVHNVAGALQAQKLGFKRVVLAREMSREQMAAVTKAIDIETEVFVHGAHCMSLSGQCYMSAMIGGRSGNRGLCAQPCRLPFSPGNEDYALSLKDMSLLGRVNELKEIGISSFKIEGRMKRPEYVAAAVVQLKNAIEGREVDFDTLRSVFSRSGFTDGYFNGSVNASMFGIRKREDVVSAAEVLKGLAKIFEKEPQRIAVDMQFTLKKDQPAHLVFTDDQGNKVSCHGEQPQTAQNMPLTAEKAESYLAKMGGTPFFLRELQCDIDDGLMLPASAVNALRRTLAEKLLATRGNFEPYPVNNAAKFDLGTAKQIAAAEKTFTVRGRLAQFTQEVLQTADRVVVGVDDLLKNIQNVINYKNKLVVEIPRVVFSGEDELEKKLHELKQAGITRAWCGNIGAVYTAQKVGMQVLGGYSLNATNSYAMNYLENIGAAECEVSIELPVGEINALKTGLPLSAVVYGHMPLMAVRNCPIKAQKGCRDCKQDNFLTDRTGAKFRVSCRFLKKSEVSEIFNSVPIYLADRLNEFRSISNFVLYFTHESAEETTEIFYKYKKGTAPQSDDGSYTRGLYYRKVQ